jgi:sterigmatocystin 8-O-methyltransferase
LYEYYDSVDLKRGNRFANAMAGHYNTPLDDPIECIYPFDTLKPDAQIVDIGGGKGQQSIRLGRKYAHMSFIVQDLSSVVESAQTTVDIPETVTGRIQWQAHNMYSPQPLHGADVYLLSHVMMDHPTR